MKNIEASLFSKAKETRYYVIDHAVYIEELVSYTLGHLLNIEWEKSKSLGFSSESMSFSQKATLIKDIQGVPKNIKIALKEFMEIRNKFAHVKSISTFQEFTRTSKERLKVMSDLLRKYEGGNIEESLENRYKYSFFKLTEEIYNFLLNLIFSTLGKRVEEKTIIERNKELLDILKEEVSNFPEATEIWDKAIKRMKDSMQKS